MPFGTARLMVWLKHGTTLLVLYHLERATTAHDDRDKEFILFFTGLVPLGTGNDSCLLIVNHELRLAAKNPILGDGGGMTVFRVNRSAATGRWNTALYKGQKYWNVDFKSVRGTYTNCGGITLPQAGQFMTAEEVVPASNLDIAGNFSDTSDFTIPSGPFKGNTYKAYLNYGWMVAVDALNAKATYKSYAMGRAPWEGGWAAPDGKTVYLTIDNTPAPFIRFIADTVGNYQYGQLQAYKQGANGVGGTWMDLPRSWDSVSNVINVAFRRGATMFTRLEWAVENGNKLYISETGNDATSYKSAQNLGGIPSWHFQRLDTLGGLPRDTAFTDYYGRVLEFDLTTNTMRPFVEGGVGRTFTFSNPDGLSVHKQDGKTFLLVVEDINGTSQRRSGGSGITICEAFLLDLTLQNPTVNDLRPFIAGAADGELTGSVSTPDGKTIFINSQHPYLLNANAQSAGSRNVAPFDNDATVSFKKDIEPLLRGACVDSVCHNNGNGQRGIGLDGYFSVSSFVKDDSSRFLGVIRHQPNFSQMPLGRPKLDTCSIRKLETWIRQGAPNN
jgi:uncharacterized protein